MKDISILAVLSTDQLIGKYIRLGDELMFVKAKSRGVLAVNTFKAFGDSACTFTITGVASGGPKCICLGSQGSSCSAGGTIHGIGGGGQEFAGTFTVASGKVTSVTVTSPGFQYMSAPDVKIYTGGTGCSGVEFHVTLTDNAVRVVRAQLGSTVQEHAANAIVNSVLWPSQDDPKRPGRRYNFRMAAYNNAGFSDFAYFDIKLYSVNPKVLPAAGGAMIEILLIGGGVTAEGYTVWIGRLANDGSVDKEKSKVCSSLTSLDLAGTRMKCKSPPWVGGQFDLIVHYKSGVYEQIAVGSSWIKYQRPEITSLTPATLYPAIPKVPVTIVVAGKNFGLDARDLVGEMVGATSIPCRPLVVVTDSSLMCTLTPHTPEDKLVGDIVITAGNATFHGKPQLTEPDDKSKIGEKPQNVSVTAKIDADHAEVTSTPAKEA